MGGRAAGARGAVPTGYGVGRRRGRWPRWAVRMTMSNVSLMAWVLESGQLRRPISCSSRPQAPTRPLKRCSDVPASRYEVGLKLTPGAAALAWPGTGAKTGRRRGLEVQLHACTGLQCVACSTVRVWMAEIRSVSLRSSSVDTKGRRQRSKSGGVSAGATRGPAQWCSPSQTSQQEAREALAS